MFHMCSISSLDFSEEILLHPLQIIISAEKLAREIWLNYKTDEFVDTQSYLFAYHLLYLQSSICIRNAQIFE